MDLVLIVELFPNREASLNTGDTSLPLIRSRTGQFIGSVSNGDETNSRTGFCVALLSVAHETLINKLSTVILVHSAGDVDVTV